MSLHLGRRHAVAAIGLAAALTVGFSPASQDPALSSAEDAFAVKLVTVDTPTRAHKDLLTTLGLDLTEHAGQDYVEVVLHTPADERALREAGLTWDVRIPDLVAREAEINRIDAEYAAAVEESPLPSGRTAYRSLADYEADMDRLAEEYPDIVKPIVIGTSLEGKPIRGIEIGRDVHGPEDGRPVFLMFGVHHAREWPSGEHTMEFAFDLVQRYGEGARITRLLDESRVIVVPVSNPDGFEKSYESGQIIDFSGTPADEVEDGLVTILATPGNAYKRKNCRVVDGQAPAAGECTAAFSPGGFGVGIDLNRNYGALWGGPGASNVPADPTYHGPAPFSEPETQAIRSLISSRQVTTVVTNHTFGNLILRPNGVNPTTIGPDGYPVGFAPDEEGMKELGGVMASHNGYRNIHGWELYDTTGTTEDYSYNATGGYGYTFEIGENEFHPPFPEVVDLYVGSGEYAGRGNRMAYFAALENAVDAATHSVIAGKAPAGATLRLQRTASTPTWDPANDFTDTVETTMVVGDDGRFEWHVNPSTRPFVMSRQVRITNEEPEQTETFTGTAQPPVVGAAEHVFELEQDADLFEVTLDWTTPDDLDLYIYRENADGEREEVASSGNLPGQKERALLQDAAAGTYVIEVVNYASVSPDYTAVASAFDAEERTVPRLFENWTLTCEVDGRILETVPVLVDRGDQVKMNLDRCRRAARRG